MKSDKKRCMEGKAESQHLERKDKERKNKRKRKKERYDVRQTKTQKVQAGK